MSLEKLILTLSTLDGTLSSDEFRGGAHAFAEKWERATHDLPLWSWVSCKNLSVGSSNEAGGYLSMEKVCLLRPDKMHGDEIDNAGDKELELLDNCDYSDPAMLVVVADEVNYYDIHIVYSNSYRIPVLYFRGYTRDGQLLMLDQIVRSLPDNSAKLLTESKWTFITQQEHPYLNRPWFTLHPCGTNELMKVLLSNASLSKEEITAERYLISWVSVVGPVVGLSIPLQMADSC